MCFVRMDRIKGTIGQEGVNCNLFYLLRVLASVLKQAQKLIQTLSVANIKPLIFFYFFFFASLPGFFHSRNLSWSNTYGDGIYGHTGKKNWKLVNVYRLIYTDTVRVN